MARTTKQLSGGGKDKFFRGLIAGVEGLPADAAAAVTAELIEHVTEVRVRRDTWQELSGQPDLPAVTPDKKKPPAQVARPTPTPTPTREPSPQPIAEPAVAAPAFDPFAFSAVAVLTRKGKAALAAELDNLVSVEHLHQIAVAQHLAVDTALKDLAAVRAALIAGTERRIAERKAAAS
jgi:hypothetical protein